MREVLQHDGGCTGQRKRIGEARVRVYQGRTRGVDHVSRGIRTRARTHTHMHPCTHTHTHTHAHAHRHL